MKRREFLSTSAGLAGALLPTFGLAQSRPCPPGTLAVAGGSQVSAACSAGDAESDWIARSTGPGVVWAHDFRYESEMTQFRASSKFTTDRDGVGYNTVSRVTTDGIGESKALQIMVPKGLPDGTHYEYNDSVSGWEVRDDTSLGNPGVGQSNAGWTWRPNGYYQSVGGVAGGGWWRPFSPINAGDNGLPTPDAAAGGSLPRRTWNSANTGENYNWKGGYYGHPSVQSASSTWGGLAAADTWHGSDFYIQFRVKLGRWRNGDMGLPATNTAKYLQFAKYPAGKLLFIGTTGITPLQEIVIRSQPIEPRQETSGSRLVMYTGQGYSVDLKKARSIQGQTVDVLQPGGDYESATSLASTCYFNNVYPIVNGQSERTCWAWPVEEWVTVLVHVIPGRPNSSWTGTGATFKDTGVEVWVARAGETSYTKVVGVGAEAVAANDAWAFVFDTNGLHPAAWNAFLPTGYMNNAPSLQAFYQRFTQIIFSKQFVPCPRA